jgi:hypothetical protein
MSSNFRYNVYNDLSTTNILIVGNPQISYFSSVYRKYTYFCVDKRESDADSINQKKSLKLQGGGGVDLLLNISIMFDINMGSDNIPDNVGTKVLDEVYYNLSKNSDIIEKISGEYIDILNNLSNPIESNSTYVLKSGSEYHVVSGSIHNILSCSGGVFNNNNSSGSINNIIVPIPFSFSNNPGNSMPIISFRDNSVVFTTNIKSDYNSKVNNFKYIYTSVHLFDNAESQRFLNNSNEYIYTRVYEIDIDKNKTYYDIPTYDIYNNIKSIIWKDTNNNKYNISINSLDLFNCDDNYLDKEYFTKIFPKKAGFIGCGKSLKGDHIVDSNDICYYTFGLKNTYDNENTPSGSINSSVNQVRIKSDNNLQMDKIYLECYNIITYGNDEAKYMFPQYTQKS